MWALLGPYKDISKYRCGRLIEIDGAPFDGDVRTKFELFTLIDGYGIAEWGEGADIHLVRD